MLKKLKTLNFKIIFLGIIGNIFEWYEFSLYAYFASNISQDFFPSHDKFSSLLETFGVFAIGFLMRPIGAMIFGYYGDKFGRKKMLSTSIVLMALSTALIAFIPNYHAIGSLSGLLLLLCRMIQGIAIGGEYSGSVVYTIEQAPEKLRGLSGSFTLFGAYFGMLIGSLVSAMILYLTSGTVYYEFAWRFCFLIGFLLGILGIYMRRYMPETPAFVQAEKKHQLYENPLVSVFTTHIKTILKGIGITLLPAVTSYTLFSYMPTFLTQFGNINLEQALWINSITMVIMLLAIPVFGFLSDLIPKKIFLYASSVLIACLAFFMFKLSLSHSLIAILLAQVFLAIFSCCSEAVIPVILASIFPTNLRYTGIAVCLNIANGFFGGTVALVLTFLIAKTHNFMIPSFYLILMACITFMTTIFLKKIPQ